MLISLLLTSAYAQDLRHPLVDSDPDLLDDYADAADAWRELAWEVGFSGEDENTSAVFVPIRIPIAPPPEVPQDTTSNALQVDDSLTKTLEDLQPPDGPLKVILTSSGDHWRPFPTMMWLEQVAMLDGVRTEEELAHVREAGFAEWRDAAQPHLDALEAAVAACDGTVDDRLWLSGQVLASMSADCVDGLISNPPDSLDSIGLQEELTLDGEGYNTPIAGTGIDGVELENMIQSGQFYGTGDDGEDSGWSVVVEGGRMWIGHPGFEDASGSARIHNCTASPGYPLYGPCTGQPTPNPGEAHKTAAASILIGDTTRGQDPTVTSSVARRERSGVARSGFGVGIESFTGSVLDNVVANSWYAPRVISRSSSTKGVSCTGTATHDIRANALFESGVALFNSNGNNGWAVECTLSSPGAALGTFTVGSYDTNANDYPLIRPSSSKGGALDGRTGMDMVAPQRFVYAYPHYDWPFSQQQQATFRYGTEWDTGQGPSWFGAASAATPTVAGGAVLVRDWFRGQYGSAIDDPGLLYAHMLLMGNRSSGNGEPGARMTSGFHSRWGAGKLRLRRLESDGLQAPAAYSSGSVCVDRNQSVIIPMANTNSDVDVIRAVAWWHDRGHDNGNGFGQVDLAVQRLDYCSGGACVYTVEGISDDTDHKQRVHIDNPVADSWSLRLDGQSDITTDIEGCGTNSVRVYYAWFAESSDRGPGPLYTVRPE